ncbi:SNF1-related protein kinase regulatory subunit gamma-1-like [Pyrus ussuriensis x Pyrus communis]|uniref:SNF1-related protein kinase regulatory subunit gamma-1-like n=1 Tax=Pyrus ussuriensis x Pyrus communis TaxID=2448454 RepID=A0A5N5I870_9ROSA|nr:SNF1-related protein kinase regulatory subunit gamma-1-like [Pyrus ussuriensis x Pyrus communis]
MQQIKDVMEKSEGGVAQKKESLVSNLKLKQTTKKLILLFWFSSKTYDAWTREKSIVSFLELKTGASVRDAIHLLYEKNVCGAPIADTTSGSFSDPYIGFIDFASMECEKLGNRSKETEAESVGKYGVFDVLEQHPHIGQTKMGELANSFIWDSYFPVQVVPIIERTNSKLIGFISQHGVLHLLLQSSGLEFGNEKHVVHVYGDQSLAGALHVLWKSRNGAVAVTDTKTKKLIGCIRNSNIYLLLENLPRNINSLTVEQFIHMETDDHEKGSDPTIERDLGALLSAGFLLLKNSFSPKMDSPVTNKKTHTLKQAMRNMADEESSFSFLVDDSNQVTAMLTLRDMIIHFAPPCIDSSFQGGGFFESALEQTGYHVKNGTIISDK